MRVTQQMLNNNMLRYMEKNLQRLAKWQTQLDTTRKINKPSDDPVGASFAMRYRSEMKASEVFLDNVDAAISWLEFTDSAMNQVNGILQQAKDLVTLGANDTNTPLSRGAIAAEIDQLIGQLKDVANSKFNGKYVFNGQRTDQPPITANPPFDSTHDTFDQGKIRLELSDSVIIDVNYHAGEVFGTAQGTGQEKSLFNILHELSNALKNDDEEGIQQAMAEVDLGMDNVLEKWADLGAKVNRVELIQKRLIDGHLNTQTMLSNTEDANMAQVITNLKSADNVYRATLASGARIIQPTLLDFLR